MRSDLKRTLFSLLPPGGPGSSGGLSQVLFGADQQGLLGRLMVFGKAATVDALCHLNAWGRCSIPMHSLQVGSVTQKPKG